MPGLLAADTASSMTLSPIRSTASLSQAKKTMNVSGAAATCGATGSGGLGWPRATCGKFVVGTAKAGAAGPAGARPGGGGSGPSADAGGVWQEARAQGAAAVAGRPQEAPQRAAQKETGGATCTPRRTEDGRFGDLVFTWMALPPGKSHFG